MSYARQSHGAHTRMLWCSRQLKSCVILCMRASPRRWLTTSGLCRQSLPAQPQPLWHVFVSYWAEATCKYLNVTGANRPCFEPNIFVANANSRKLCCRCLSDVSQDLESFFLCHALLTRQLHSPLSIINAVWPFCEHCCSDALVRGAQARGE